MLPLLSVDSVDVGVDREDAADAGRELAGQGPLGVLVVALAQQRRRRRQRGLAAEGQVALLRVDVEEVVGGARVGEVEGQPDAGQEGDDEDDRAEHRAPGDGHPDPAQHQRAAADQDPGQRFVKQFAEVVAAQIVRVPFFRRFRLRQVQRACASPRAFTSQNPCA